MGTWRGPCPSQCPVPWGGGHRAGLGNVRHEGGNKADYCPPERVLVLGQGDGWLTGYSLDGRWSFNYAGWPACLPTEEAWRPCAGLQGLRSQALRMEGYWKSAGLMADKKAEQEFERTPVFIFIFIRLSGVGSRGEQLKQGAPDFPFPGHIDQL
ncbi:unnamed protein product [Pleuronectes platessa]|uniref:Uncharacterized protein n=1 Tax=Pleuronectes platessa TaxID=8262 RepID=A0A9N7Y567_PLEPL|nr:unnamed protein product [Pleuronectes platessa]